MQLTNARYEEIKTTIAEFYEDYDIKKIPIDVFAIAKLMKVKIVFASEILHKYSKNIDELILMKHPPSYLCYNESSQKFIVYIDDIGCKKKRQRFSLAHELMHIMLNHMEQSEENESEANFGATYLLSPTSLALLQ